MTSIQIAAIRIRGTLTVPGDTEESPPKKIVMQRTGTGKGNVLNDKTRSLQIRAHVIPSDPKTDAQLTRRTTFADAMHAWATLDAPTRTAFHARASKLGLDGANLFVRDYIATHSG